MARAYLQIDATLLGDLEALARRRGVPTCRLVEDVLREAIRKQTRRARRSARTEEPLLASVRRLLAGDLAAATGWADLDRRLARHGLQMAEAGGGVAVVRRSDGRKLCKGSEIGAAYADLMRRFRAPMPGHSHGWMADRILGPGWRAAGRPPAGRVDLIVDQGCQSRT